MVSVVILFYFYIVYIFVYKCIENFEIIPPESLNQKGKQNKEPTGNFFFSRFLVFLVFFDFTEICQATKTDKKLVEIY